MQAFCSMSGGKDSMMALYRALKIDDLKVTHLLNTVTEDGKHSRSHGIKSTIMRQQAEALNLPILQMPTTWETYEDEFKKGVRQLKKEGVDTGIFGDIDLEPHREWVERVCDELGIKAILPLWLEDREKLMREFMEAGFSALVTATESSYMGEEWLGRPMDDAFIKDIYAHNAANENEIDLCGEKGEYHTLVTDGPLFHKKLVVEKTEPTKVNQHWFLNITGCRLAKKESQ